MGIKPSLKPTTNDRMKTVCSRCGYGIFDWHDRIWSRDPLGLVHANRADCHEPRS